MTDDLRRLASEATPGPWRLDERVGVVAVYAGPPQGCLAQPHDPFIHAAEGRWDTVNARWELDPQVVADAAYIAALSPSTVLPLLDVVEAARDVDGMWSGSDGQVIRWLPETSEALNDLRAALDALGEPGGTG